MATQPEVVQLARLGAEAILDIAEAFSIGQLRESHAQILVEARKSADVEIALVFADQAAERMPRREFHYLSEDQLSSVHLQASQMSGKPALTLDGIQIVNTFKGAGARVC